LARCTIIGMGHIGTALYFDLDGRVESLTGLDTDPGRVETLRAQGRRATSDYADCEGTDTWIITSSTGRDMRNVFAIAQSFTPAPGALISVESTLAVGTMARLAAYYRSKGIEPGSGVFLVHAPHRIMFGKDSSTLSMPRVIGGVTPECLARGVRFYSALGATLVPVGDVRVAELAKLVENSLRHVNIAFAEATAMACRAAGLDFGALCAAVNTKDNVHLMDVDYGIGGECLPKDIELLQGFARSPLLGSAEVVDREYRRRLFAGVMHSGGNILVRGITYKAGVADTSHSPGLDLVRALDDAGATVEVYDPLVPPTEISRMGLVPSGQPFDPARYSTVVERGKIIQERPVADVDDTRDGE